MLYRLGSTLEVYRLDSTIHVVLARIKKLLERGDVLSFKAAFLYYMLIDERI